MCDEAINNKRITPFAQKNGEAVDYQVKQNKSESHFFLSTMLNLEQLNRW